MKKSTFDRCRRAVPTMTSVQRHDLKVAIELRDKKDLVAAVVSLVGTPPRVPIAAIRRSGPGGMRTDFRAFAAGDASAPSMR